jgi:quercetin dioxygenase-like cupin family protein
MVVNVIEGKFRITVGNNTTEIEAGDVVIIPSQVLHTVTALTSGRIIDVFYPVREDYKL